jgi:hypothetical protein
MTRHMELVSSGMRLNMIARRRVQPIGGLSQAQPVVRQSDLTQAQLQWLAEKHPGIFRNRVERVEKR